MTSVTTGSPVSRLASARYLSPSSSSPWKEYGDVRGLKAPPRKTRAPAALTFAATSSTCPRDSTEHGPAITTISYAVFCLKKKKKIPLDSYSHRYPRAQLVRLLKALCIHYIAQQCYPS